MPKKFVCWPVPVGLMIQWVGVRRLSVRAGEDEEKDELYVERPTDAPFYK